MKATFEPKGSFEKSFFTNLSLSLFLFCDLPLDIPAPSFVSLHLLFSTLVPSSARIFEPHTLALRGNFTPSSFLSFLFIIRFASFCRATRLGIPSRSKRTSWALEHSRKSPSFRGDILWRKRISHAPAAESNSRKKTRNTSLILLSHVLFPRPG